MDSRRWVWLKWRLAGGSLSFRDWCVHVDLLRTAKREAGGSDVALVARLLESYGAREQADE